MKPTTRVDAEGTARVGERVLEGVKPSLAKGSGGLPHTIFKIWVLSPAI